MNLIEELESITSVFWKGSCSETRLNYRHHHISVAKWNWTTYLVWVSLKKSGILNIICIRDAYIFSNG